VMVEPRLQVNVINVLMGSSIPKVTTKFSSAIFRNPVNFWYKGPGSG